MTVRAKATAGASAVLVKISLCFGVDIIVHAQYTRKSLCFPDISLSNEAPQRSVVVPKVFEDKEQQYQEPHHQNVQVMSLNKAADLLQRPRDSNELLAQIVLQGVPKNGDGYDPGGNTIWTQRVNTIGTLEE